ncbi:MAG: FtsX-like permease family protein [Bacteroidales bacterium]|nr:FtsX-like permease family protein [Bacteroidales bacterium]
MLINCFKTAFRYLINCRTYSLVNVLNGDHGLSNKSGLARKILVVIQFTISISLICTMVIHSQLNYLKNADLGFNKENIMIIPVNRTPVARSYDAFSRELLNDSRITGVTAMDDIFGSAHNTHEFRPEGFPEKQWQFYPALVVKWNFVETFGLKIVAGRDYSELHKSDPEKGILINESMVRHMGWESNKAAIGKKFKSLNGEERIIGQEVIDHVQKVWANYAPTRPFEYSFLEQELEDLYDDEANLSLLSLIFTILILVIAGLGIFGLGSFMAEKRTREFGIRKVLGAETRHIVKLLSIEFFWLIFIASALAWIISGLLITDWLNHFAYRASLNWFIFLAAAVIAIVIALSITTLKALNASKINPVETLSYE